MARPANYFFLFVFILSPITGKELRINFQNNFGYTIVNVGEAMEIPEYSEITDEGLVSWNQFNYKGLLQFWFVKNDQVSLGPELGINRLYYWEEKYIPQGSSPRWRWGTIWTAQAGFQFRRTLATHYYISTGTNVHLFLNGTGITLGIPLSLGHELPISKDFTIPIEFRIDIIFGDAVPIALGGGVGLKFRLK